MHVRTLATLLLVSAWPVAGRTAMLISPQEARLAGTQVSGAMPASGAAGLAGDRGTPTRGPDIVIQSPRGAVSSPFPLRVTFTPHNGATIDPSTVAVTLLSKPEVDLTGRVAPFLTARGIDFTQAEVPPGAYRLRIDLADSAGHTATSIVDLQVQHP